MIEWLQGYETLVGNSSMDDFDAGQTNETTLNLSSTTGTSQAQGNQTAEPAGLSPGSLFLEKYKIMDRIGSGGMGVVYRCSQVFIGKDMAIKTLNQSSMNDEAVQRFQTEAKAAGSLSHPNLVSVHDFGVTPEGTPYMVMDYVPGKTLQDVLSAHGQLELETVLDIFIQCADGLAHAHEKGVLHRDIKPSNIVLMQERNIGPGSIRILDFGIAKINSNSTQTQELTRTGMVIGSPLYMSPEQSIGKRMDWRTDIYSLGCVLYECLCGMPPFQGDTVIETLMLHQTEKPRTLKEASLGREFPKRLQDLVSSMMEKAFEDRVNSMTIVHHELVEIKDQLKNPGKIQKFQKLEKIATAPPLSAALDPGSRWLSVPVLIGIGALAAAVISYFMWTLLTPQTQPVKKIGLMDASFATPGEERASYDQRVKRGIAESKARGQDSVSLDTVEFSQSQFELIAKEKWIRELNLVDCQGLTAYGLDTILANPIEKLSLHQSEVSEEVFAAIARSKTLRSLDVSKCKKVTEEGLIKVARMKHLVSLNMQSVPVTDKVLEELMANNHEFFDINLSLNTPINDNAVRLIAKHKKEYGLDVSYTSVTDAGVKQLGIKCVYFGAAGDPKITDAGIDYIVKNCPKMRSLQLPGTSITPNGIMKLTQLKELNALELGVVKVSEDERKRIRAAFEARKVKLSGF